MTTNKKAGETKCKHCGGDTAIRNPSGYCDHLHYPENCAVCSGDTPASGDWKDNAETIADAFSESQFDFRLLKERIEKVVDTVLSDYKKQMEEKMIQVIKNSRTLDEHYGVGVREETARTQVIADILSSLKDDQTKV